MISEPQFTKLTIPLFLEALYTVSQSQDQNARSMANQWLVKSQSNNPEEIFEITFIVIRNKLPTQIQSLNQMNPEYFPLLAVCYLRQLIIEGKINFGFDVPEKFCQLYQDINNNKHISQKVLECLILYLNSPGKYRIKKQYMDNSIAYLSSNYPNNFSPGILEIISKILGTPMEKSQHGIVINLSHAIHRFIKVYSNQNPPLNISNVLWDKIILGLANFSTIPPPFRFIARGIVSQNSQNLDRIDLDCYLSFLKLYGEGSGDGHYDQTNSPTLQIHYQILQGILIKISLGIVQKIFADNYGIQGIEMLLQALSRALKECCEFARQDQVCKNYLQNNNIISNQYFKNLAIILTQILAFSSENNFEALNFNPSIKRLTSKIIQELLDFQIEGEAGTWVDEYFNYYNSPLLENKIILLIFLSILPRIPLQQIQATQVLMNQIRSQIIGFENSEKTDQQMEYDLAFNSFVEHYVSSYEYFETDQILRQISLYAQGILSFNFHYQKNQNYEKYNLLKASSVSILCKLQKFHLSRDYSSRNLFTDNVLNVSMEILYNSINNNSRNCTTVSEKIVQTIQHLAEIMRYSSIVYQKLIITIYKLLSQLQGTDSDQFKQSFAHLCGQFFILLSTAMDNTTIDTNMVNLLAYYFNLINQTSISKYCISIQQSVIELIFRIVSQLNQSNEQVKDKLTITQDKELNLQPKLMLIQIQIRTNLLNQILIKRNFLEYDKNVLILCTQIILQFIIHQEFIEKIYEYLLHIYKQAVNNKEFADIVTVLNVIWEAAFILYDNLKQIPELQQMQFYERVARIKTWDIEKMLNRMNIDPEEMNNYMEETKKNEAEYQYKWSKLPQVKKIINPNSLVAQKVDEKLTFLLT